MLEIFIPFENWQDSQSSQRMFHHLIHKGLQYMFRRKVMKRNERQYEREMSSAGPENQRRVRDIVFLIAGIGIGSGIALLFAPTSGEEARYAISRRYRKTVKNIGRKTENLRDRAEDLLEHAQDLRERGSRLLQWRRRAVARRAA
jgi:hypothetical protein